MKPLPTPKEIVREAIAKGWVTLPVVKAPTAKEVKQRISRGETPEERKAYWRNRMRQWRRDHPERVREYNRRRRKPNPVRKFTGIPVSQLNDSRTYHRLYMRLQRTGTTVSFHRNPKDQN